MLAEFKKFIARGSMLDLAVGIIIGAAFGGLISSLVNDILMPPIGFLLGGVDFSNLFLDLSGGGYASLAEAQAAGAPTINYGVFINTLISFLIVMVAIFLIVKAYNRMREKGAEESEVRACPRCQMDIPRTATRCGHCTSDVQPA